MVCKYCHAELEEGSKLCPVCGKQLQEEETQVIAEEVCVPEESPTEACAPEEAAEQIQTSEPVDGESVEDEEALATEAKAQKREKLLVKVTVLVSCAVLVLALALGIWVAVGGSSLVRKNDLLGNESYAVEDSAARKAADTVVATLGDAKLTNSQLQMLYWDEVYNFINEYYAYLSYLGLDYTQPLSEQYATDGEMTWEQFFLRNALNSWHQYQALAMEAESQGYQPSANVQEFLDTLPENMLAAAVSNGFATVDEMAESDYGPGSTGEDYETYLRLYYNAVGYFDDLYLAIEPTQEELDAYFAANAQTLSTNYGVTKESGRLIDVRHILILPEGGITDDAGNTTYSEKEWEACRMAAQELLDQWKAGEATEESFALLASQNTQDPGSQSTGGLYEKVYEGKMVPAFNDWCFDLTRQPGDTGLVRTEYGYHIMYYVYGDEGWIRYSTEGVMSEKGGELLEQIMEKYPIDVNYKKIKLGQIELG